MKKAVSIVIALSVVLLSGYFCLDHYDYKMNHPGVYPFEDKMTGEIVMFKIGHFPSGWSKQYNFSGSTSTREIIDMEKPAELPGWIRWDHYSRLAYLGGRMSFNDDSTLLLVNGPGPKLSDEVREKVAQSLRRGEVYIGKEKTRYQATKNQ